MKKYKIWVHIEEVDEEHDHYQDIDLPYEAGCFDDVDSARKFVDDKLIMLREQSPDFPPKSIMLRLFAENGKLWIRPEGYGEKCTIDGEGSPVGIEIWQGRLRLIVFNDINSEDPQTIDLENARETSRNRCNWCDKEVEAGSIIWDGLLFCSESCLDACRAVQ